MKNNYEYSKILLNWCQEKNVQYIGASSASVYGLGKRGFKEQRDCENPINMYAFSKFQFLNECKIHFSEALQTMTESKNEEVILLELKLGLEFLNLIIGTKTNEDMLDKLFNSFCIGK